MIAKCFNSQLLFQAKRRFQRVECAETCQQVVSSVCDMTGTAFPDPLPV